MMNLHEPVYLRFRGRTRRLPLIAVAAALRRDALGAAESLEILISGPPELRPGVTPTPSRVTHVPASSVPRGEGDIGGGVHEQVPVSLCCRQEHRDGGVGEGGRDATAFAEAIAAQLGPAVNRAALRRLVSMYPEPILSEALVRTMRIAPERIRTTRGAVFTGIVRKLATDDKHSPTP